MKNRSGYTLALLMVIIAAMAVLATTLARTHVAAMVAARRAALVVAAEELAVTAAAARVAAIGEADTVETTDVIEDLALAQGTLGATVTTVPSDDGGWVVTSCATVTPHSEVVLPGPWEHCEVISVRADGTRSNVERRAGNMR